MDSAAPLRQSASVSSRLSAIDVSQLDKINAIPNKSTNNVLTDGLCQEDQLYLDALMDEESLDSDEDNTPNLTDHGGSPWSPPMAGRPMMNNKRIKRIKPAYTITLSLEDISYIRPSWGISKGIKRIELSKDKRKHKSKKVDEKSASFDKKQAENAKIKNDQQTSQKKEKTSLLLNPYHVSLAILVLILVSLMVLSYFVDIRRRHEKRYRFKLDFAPLERRFKIMKLEDGQMLENRAFLVNYGRGVPKNLKHDECTCEMYEAETRRYQPSGTLMRDAPGGRDRFDLEDANKGGDCFACFDWSHRANIQVMVNSSTLASHHDSLQSRQSQPVSLDEDQSITCYDIKWQSYDTLRTPLMDCFHINEGDQWFGLGDIQNPTWPLNKFNQLEAALIASNISSEFNFGSPLDSLVRIDGDAFNSTEQTPPLKADQKLTFGSHVELQLLTSSGFFVGNLKTDFRPSIKISAERREICLSVSCSEHCTRTWSRPDDLKKFKYRNNLLEYSICSASNLRVLVARLVSERSRRFAPVAATTNPVASSATAKQVVETRELSSSSIERLELNGVASSMTAMPIVTNQQQEQRLQTFSQPIPIATNGASTPGQSVVSSSSKRLLDGIGLVERTLFVTSPEYIETLDGQTLREHVDKIVKLNLKTSPILVLDTRWQLYLGSFRINSAYFPKAKLLFEILHNKGFKLVLTIKPYIDASIGVPSLNQLLESKRIVTAQYRNYNQLVDNNSYAINPLAERAFVIRRQSFFRYKNETILITNRKHHSKTPYLFKCKESHDGHCVLIDLVNVQNRFWLIDLMKRSNFLTQETDGILLAGTHPDPSEWDDNYRNATADLIDKLFYKENLFVIPQWTGNFNYIQLAPRSCDWDGLRTTVSSVLTLSMLGFSLVHPGSVWGDLRLDAPSRSVLSTGSNKPPSDPIKVAVDDEELRAEEELIVRWLQVAVFLPILQFNDLAPIDKFSLHNQVQNLVRLRKLFIVPEIKKNLPPTPLLNNTISNEARSRPQTILTQLPALRQTWSNMVLSGAGGGNGSNSTNSGTGTGSNGGSHSNGFQSSQQQQESHAAEAVSQQFMIGPDILVAPVLNAGQRQKDIYLPAGIWHDELRQTNIRGGKWLRNYPIELQEVAWFTRARR